MITKSSRVEASDFQFYKEWLISENIIAELLILELLTRRQFKRRETLKFSQGI